LVSSEVDPSQISLEITESLAMEDADRTIQLLTRLKKLGVKVSIDDFGTGYSALGYLASFPVDVVKVDRSFVERVEVDPVKSAIVSAVVNLSKAIGITTVIEGVETKEQLEHLRAIGSTTVQGFYFAKPMPADSLTALLDDTMYLHGGEAPVPMTKARRHVA
jgi:EAL domain-containing protein (putative c-di-GMP-specific phosphodiesterase class I)